MPTLGGNGNDEPMPEGWGRPAASRVGRIGDWNRSDAPAPSGGRRLATLGDMQSSAGGMPSGAPGGFGRDDDEDDDEDGDQPNTESWFAGGERSGLSIQNPDLRNRVPGGDTVRDLLRRAAEAGPPAATVSQPSRAFYGGGNVLGGDEVESQFIPDPNAPPEREQETAIRQLTFWKDGFSVGDGELMRYDDPANERILAEINSGHAPPSILDVLPGQPVELRVARRLEENYQPSPKTMKAFSGQGNRLGAPLPAEATGTSSMPGSFPAAAPSSPPRQSLTTRFEVDQNAPMTSIQIRLADGTRMVCRVNHTHTVGDIRNFINASRPENLTRPYTIGTAFPNRILDNDTLTIKDAGLINSVVIQKFA